VEDNDPTLVRKKHAEPKDAKEKHEDEMLENTEQNIKNIAKEIENVSKLAENIFLNFNFYLSYSKN